MNTVNLLDFLNNTKTLFTLDYAVCSEKLVDFLELLNEDEQFIRKIDAGVIYLSQNTLNQYTIIDGMNRFISLSLLLHAICECHKKTTPRNDKAIRTIRKKYLLDGTKTKLRLPKEIQPIYEKIIYGERLSGREKEHIVFKTLHKYWTKIKEEKLSASEIFNMLQKFQIITDEIGEISQRDLYYTLNKDIKNINQLNIIENYLKDFKLKNEWSELKEIFNNKTADIVLFFKDYFTTKFSFRVYNENLLYYAFENYFETMLKYRKEKEIFHNLINSAKRYKTILNVEFTDIKVKEAFIQIKMHNGEDTYAYILNVYEDYLDNNISYGTFLEILKTIDEYLINRIKTPNNVAFNDLVKYLNAYITCK